MIGSNFENQRTSACLSEFDAVKPAAIDYVTKRHMPEERNLEILKKYNIRIGEVVRAQLYSGGGYVLPSDTTWLLDVKFGLFSSITVLKTDCDPEVVPNLIGKRVAIIVGLKPSCETGNEVSHVISGDTTEKVIKGKARVVSEVLHPSSKFITGKTLRFCSGDQEEDSLLKSTPALTLSLLATAGLVGVISAFTLGRCKFSS